MKLPESHLAYVDLAKMSGYCLNPNHSRSQHKATVFAAVLGFTVTHAIDLQSQLLKAARQEEASPGENDEYGQRYILDFEAVGPGGRGVIRSSWIIRTGESFPRLVTCYVL